MSDTLRAIEEPQVGMFADEPPPPPVSLADRFVVPPFSVLDARQGYWQDRKRAWLSVGIDSELGRAAATFNTAGNIAGEQSGTSIFDPVLCELAYRWFSPTDGIVLDPFAGGSVRGVVAEILGRRYVGVDLRPEQIAANQAQGSRVCPVRAPRWLAGDSANIRELAAGEYDFLFSCPPYADLEVYSDDPRDLSRMDYGGFLSAYRWIIAASVTMLRHDRFACFVVGDVRDSKGIYRNLVAETVSAFQAAGMSLYNEAVFLTPLGTVPQRAGQQFVASRKLGKTHQNVLVFVKGDPKKAAAACEANPLTEGEAA